MDITTNRFGLNYKPFLFGDEELLERKASLIHNIISSTRSNAKPTMISYEARKAAWSTPLPEVPNDSGIATNHLSRWKFAFREMKKVSKGSAPLPTMMRTREGRWRVVTPLEEYNRSWSQKSRHVDVIEHRAKALQYVDPDGDEERAKLIPLEKYRKRKELLKAAGLAK